MPETPKEKCETEKDKNDAREKASWSEDQKKHEYYYDDAHGYEVFSPDNDEEDVEEEPKKPSESE